MGEVTEEVRYSLFPHLEFHLFVSQGRFQNQLTVGLSSFQSKEGKEVKKKKKKKKRWLLMLKQNGGEQKRERVMDFEDSPLMPGVLSGQSGV